MHNVIATPTFFAGKGWAFGAASFLPILLGAVAKRKYKIPNGAVKGNGVAKLLEAFHKAYGSIIKPPGHQ